MSKKYQFFLIILTALGISFFAGYHVGESATLDKFASRQLLFSPSDNIDSSNDSPVLGTRPDQDSPDTTQEQAQDKDKPTTQREELAKTEEEDASAFDAKLAKLETMVEANQVQDMLDYLLEVSKSDNPDDMEMYGPTIEALEEAVRNDPSNLQLLSDYFIDVDTDSSAPFYIVSILQSLDTDQGNAAINSLYNRLTAIGTDQSNEKLLNLISNTGIHYENPQIIETVKSIALYGQYGSENRMYALDLLMPFQLNNDEKRKVVNDFTYALQQAPSENKSYLVENIIRFSDKSSRTQLAENYLKDNNDFATRVAILSTLHSGSVPTNDNLKKTLFNIAQNTQDPLNEHAKHALMYVFEIDNEEYKQLAPGGP